MDRDSAFGASTYARTEGRNTTRTTRSAVSGAQKTLSESRPEVAREPPTGGPLFNSALTLRKACLAYRDAGGRAWDYGSPAEYDRAPNKASFYPLRRFDNPFGHMVEGHDGHYTVCAPPVMCTNTVQFANSLTVALSAALSSGTLWDCRGTVLVSKTREGWSSAGRLLPQTICDSLDRLTSGPPAPLSAHIPHAVSETMHRGRTSACPTLFDVPSETGRTPGLFGTLHSNQAIDMSPLEEEGVPDREARKRMPWHKGFICAGYTSHSTDAGRSVRVCHKVSVRIFSRATLGVVTGALLRCEHEDGEWLLFCMGVMLRCSEATIVSVSKRIQQTSLAFESRPTVHISAESKVAVVSVSSGVLVRPSAEYGAVDSTSLHRSTYPPSTRAPSIGARVEDLFSTHFSLIPFLTSDRPPRTLLAAVQGPQAVCAPHQVASSLIAPVHVSKPLTYTTMGEKLMKDMPDDPEIGLVQCPPGEDLVMCLANYGDNYEDAVMVSQAAIDRGLFSYTSRSTHILMASEPCPEVGGRVRMTEHPWWKCYPRRRGQRSSLVRHVGKDTVSLEECDGIVVSKSTTAAGDVRVEVERYGLPVTGDKVSTPHGQKGVLRIWSEHDMPFTMDDNEQPVRFDVVMSTSAVLNRVTLGQYFEMCSGREACENPRPSHPHGAPSLYDATPVAEPARACALYDGRTGELIMESSGDGTLPVAASWGVTRVWQMSQLSWDKQHYTHNPLGKHSLAPPVGRSRGGAVRLGEMEVHAMASSGLIGSLIELKNRTEVVRAPVCSRCHRMAYLCTCEGEGVFVDFALPLGTIAMDCVSAITNGHAFEYSALPEGEGT